MIHLFRAPPRMSVQLPSLHVFVRQLVQTDNLCEHVAHLWQLGLCNGEKDHSLTEQRILCLLKKKCVWTGGFKIFTEQVFGTEPKHDCQQRESVLSSLL